MEKLIPLGSVVCLKEGQQKIMILDRSPQVDTGDGIKMFEYSGCIYPVGLMVDQILYFNTENIDQVIFEGYSDEDEIKFNELHQEWLETEGKNVTRGKVEKSLEN